MEKLKISLPVIVEGRYDKSALSAVMEGTVIPVGGFAIFNDRQKQEFLRRVAGERGVILLTDSDGGGRQIRSFLLGILPKEKVHQLFIPRVPGKERRKKHPSRAGVLGVEGMDDKTLRRLLAPFADGAEAPVSRPVTKTDLYVAGLSGPPDAVARRAALCRRFSLPEDMTANGLLEALNLLVGYEAFCAAVEQIDGENAGQGKPEQEEQKGRDG